MTRQVNLHRSYGYISISNSVKVRSGPGILLRASRSDPIYATTVGIEAPNHRLRPVPLPKAGNRKARQVVPRHIWYIYVQDTVVRYEEIYEGVAIVDAQAPGVLVFYP